VNAVGTAHAEAWDTLTAGPDGTRQSAAPAYRPPPRDTSARAGTRRPGEGASANTPDSASVAGALARVPRDRDVVDADTIIGHFIQVDTATARPASPAAPSTAPRTPGRGTVAGRPAAPADTTRPEPKTELDRMQAFGDARALYRLKPKQDSTSRGRRNEKAGINYVIGDTIDLQMAHGEVETAHVRGLKRGIYLDPEQVRSDSAAAPATPGAASGTAAPGARTPATGPVTRPTGATPAAGTSRAVGGSLSAPAGTSPAPGAPQPGQAPPPPRADAPLAAEEGK
jgi:hypothetical protein